MQDDTPDFGRAFLRLKESLGSLLLCWSRLEDALAGALQRTSAPSPRSAGSFGERLATLESHLAVEPDGGSAPETRHLARRIDDVRRRRNLIAHRLTGFCADPARGEPHIVCEDGGEGRRASVRITQGELSDLLAEIDRCTRDLGRVGAARRQVRGRSPIR